MMWLQHVAVNNASFYSFYANQTIPSLIRCCVQTNNRRESTVSTVHITLCVFNHTTSHHVTAISSEQVSPSGALTRRAAVLVWDEYDVQPHSFNFFLEVISVWLPQYVICSEGGCFNPQRQLYIFSPLFVRYPTLNDIFWCKTWHRGECSVTITTDLSGRCRLQTKSYKARDALLLQKRVCVVQIHSIFGNLEWLVHRHLIKNVWMMFGWW